MFSSEDNASYGLIYFYQGANLKGFAVSHHYPTEPVILVPEYLGYTLNPNKKNNTMY